MTFTITWPMLRFLLVFVLGAVCGVFAFCTWLFRRQ